jgi:predicted phage tail protein
VAAASRDYELDTSAPATGITSSPTTPGSSRQPSWGFFAESGAGYSCRLERAGSFDTGWVACASPHPFDLTGRSDGLYTFSVRATDTAGNTGPVTTNGYLLDTTAPGAPVVTSAPGSPGRSRSPSWSFSGDAGATLSCRLDQGATPVSGWAACSSNVAYDLSGRPDATYTFSLRATDAAGNDGPATTRDYALDTTAPPLPMIVSAPPAAGVDTAPSWSFTGEAGATFECRLDRGATPFSGWGPCPGSIGYDLTGQPDGVFTFSVRAIDSVGNVGAPRTRDYELVTSTPDAPAWTSEPLATGNSTAPSWGFSLPAGTTAECRVERGSNVVSDWSACVSPYSADLAGRADGAYELAVRAVNGVGTRSTATRGAYTLDTHAPAAPSIVAKPGAIGANPTPSWSFTAEDGATLECRVERESDLVADWATCASPYAVTLVGRPDGTYTVSVRARDAAGNTGEAAQNSYRLLTSAPGAPRFTAAPGPIGRTRDVTWSFSAGDGDALECRLTRAGDVTADWVACTSPRQYDLTSQPDDSYEFAVRARNAAGTTGTPASSTYLLDTQAPARPSVTTSPRGVDRDRTPTWAFSAEAGATVECRLRARRGDAEWRGCASPRSVSLRGRDDGDYLFELRATDAAGNVSPTLARAYELDTTAPREPRLTAAPGAEGSDRTPAWAFSGEVNASFECQLRYGDDRSEEWADCASPKRYHLAADEPGTYAFAVRATDEAGNTGATTTSSYRLVAAPGSGSGQAPAGGPGGAPAAPPAADPSPAATPPAAEAGGPESKPRAGDSPAAGSDGRRAGNGRNAGGGGAGSRKAGEGSRRRHAADGGPGPADRGQRKRGTLGKSIDFARKAIAEAATVVRENADKTVFPVSLLVIVALFLLVQGRIDRNDPKLALAPLLADTQIEFGPAARLPGLEDGAARADTRRGPGRKEGRV